MREAIATDRAPQAIGPYSQAVRAGSSQFTARVRSPLIPPPGSLSTATSPFRRARSSPISVGVLEAAGRSLGPGREDHGLPGGHGRLRGDERVYVTFFVAAAPARSTIQAARLPRDARVEIDVDSPGGRL